MKRKLFTLMTLLLTVCSGAWGGNQTYTVSSPSQTSYTDATSGISVIGKQTTGKIDNTSGQNVYSVKNANNVLHISSVKANIKGVSFEYAASKASSLNVYTSTGSQFAIPTSGFTATLDGNSQATLSTITVNAGDNSHQTLSVTFNDAVSMLYVTTGSSQAVLIRNITVTYDDAITVPSLYATIVPSGTANKYNITGEGSMTASAIGASKMADMADDFYQLTGSNTYTPAEDLVAGDVIVFTLANASSNTMGIKTPVVGDDYQITFSKSEAKTPYQFVYVVKEDLKTVSFARKSSADYLKDVKVYHNKAVTHSVSAVTSTGDDSFGTVSAASATVAEGKTTVITAFPKTGYKVSNWAVSGTGASITPEGASNSLTTVLTMGTTDAIVTCTFVAAATYTISYGAGSSEGVTGSRDSDIKTEDIAFTLPSIAVFKRTGYIQTGWNTNPDGVSGSHYDLGGVYTTNATQTFYPEWTATDFNFAPSKGSGSISNGDIITASTGGKMVCSIDGTKTTMSYASSSIGNCIQFGYDSDASGSGNGGVTVTLDKKMQAGTIITGTLYWSTEQTNRGVDLQNASGTKKGEWYFNAPAEGGSATFTYTVVEGDGLAESNVFKLVRKNSVYLVSLAVVNCADEYAITPANDRSTYVTPADLDFTGIDGLTAYVATGKGTGTVVMSPVTAVPANTPLMLIGTASTTYYVPVAAEASAPETNYLKVGPKTFDGTENDKYILWTDGLFHLVAAGTLAANKAYLDLEEAGARELSIVFEGEGETTGINTALMNNERMNNEVYNLNGQRMAQPTKGLYIVNGRKVVIK